MSFSSLSEETIMDIIASLMVLPNRMCIPLIDQVKVDQMRFPLPRVRKVCFQILEVWTESGRRTWTNWVVSSRSFLQGVVRVHLLEAKDLVAKDTYMMGLVKGKSDPYAIIRVGNRTFKSKTVKENLDPKWNEVYEVELRPFLAWTLQRQSVHIFCLNVLLLQSKIVLLCSKSVSLIYLRCSY